MARNQDFVVRNTFLEVDEKERVDTKCEGWRRLVSEPVELYSTSCREEQSPYDEYEAGEESARGLSCDNLDSSMTPEQQRIRVAKAQGAQAALGGSIVVVKKTFFEVEKIDGETRTRSESEPTSLPQRWGEMDLSDDEIFVQPAVKEVSIALDELFAHGSVTLGPDDGVDTITITSRQRRMRSQGTDWHQGHAGAARGKQVPPPHDGYGSMRRSSKEEKPRQNNPRDGQLGFLKDESITRQEPPWCGVTTVMMRNLPNKYTQQMLLNELRDAGFKLREDYDFFYLPMDHNNCANLGYCFINFTATSRANAFAAAFSGQKLRRFNSHKTALIMPASIQGYERNYSYYVSTRVSQAADPQYRPLFLKHEKPSSELMAFDVDEFSTAGLQVTRPSGGLGTTASRRRQARQTERNARKESWESWESTQSSGGEVMCLDPDQSTVNVVQQQNCGPSFCFNCGNACGIEFRFCGFCGASLANLGCEAGSMMMMAPMNAGAIGFMLAPQMMALPMPLMHYST